MFRRRPDWMQATASRYVVKQTGAWKRHADYFQTRWLVPLILCVLLTA
jgi:hypothetical protein